MINQSKFLVFICIQLVTSISFSQSYPVVVEYLNGAEIQKSYFCKLKVSGHTIEANCPGAHNLTFSSEEMATLPLPASFTLDRITKPVSLQAKAGAPESQEEQHNTDGRVENGFVSHLL